MSPTDSLPDEIVGQGVITTILGETPFETFGTSWPSDPDNGNPQDSLAPNAEFKAADRSKAQRFGLPLPKELASGGAVKLNVYLVPFKGAGSGALLEIGGTEIR